MLEHSHNPDSQIVPATAMPAIAAALAGLRFGQVTVTVHEGQVVQIDRTERHRLTRTNGNSGAADSVHS